MEIILITILIILCFEYQQDVEYKREKAIWEAQSFEYKGGRYNKDFFYIDENGNLMIIGGNRHE